MSCVAEGIKKRNYIFINAIVDRNDVTLWNNKVLGKGSIAVHAHTLCMLTPLPVPGPTVAAMAAYDMPFAGYDLSDSIIFYTETECVDFTDIFMADDHWRLNVFLTPGIPIINMYIRATD